MVGIAPMRLRTRWVALSLHSVVILGALQCAGSAHASPNESTSRRAYDSIGSSLPPGVFRKANGRYVRELCAHPAARQIRCLAKQWLPPSWQPNEATSGLLPETADGGAAKPSPISPSLIDSVYGIPATARAKGRTVAIVDTPDNHAFSDLAAYRAMLGMPALERCGGVPTGNGIACFAQVAEDGGPSSNTDPLPAYDGETSLDAAMVSLACPDCSILLVELEPTLCESDLLKGVATAARLGASAISISFAGPEATDPHAIAVAGGRAASAATSCPAEANSPSDPRGPFSTPGHLVFAAAGDYGYDSVHYAFSPTVGGAAPSYPASSPDVVAVGGTALYWSAASSREGIWNRTTSGCSTEFGSPPWQVPLLSGSSCTGRATADISAMATFFSDGIELGLEVIVDGQPLVTEGTSASAPLVAGIFTRLELTTQVSSDLSLIYQHSSSFNDIGSRSYPLPERTSDSNAPAGSSCGILCNVGLGWDGPSGVGSPNGAKLSAWAVHSGTELTRTEPASDGSASNGCAFEVRSHGRSPSGVAIATMLVLALLTRRRHHSTL